MCTRKIAGVLRALTGSAHPKNFTSAIIAAAGSSTRFEGELTKQMTPVCGVPMIVHTLLAFENTECIHEIIIVAKRSEMGVYEELCSRHNIKKLTRVIAGGETRQESVLAGFDAIDKRSKYVAISDGARCLVTPEDITAVCRAAYKYDAATAAHRATDTVKIANKRGFIDETLDRRTVWLAATPQVFKTKLYRAAAYTAVRKGFEATDDNMLVERIKHPVRLVECSPTNIKITAKEDMTYARSVLEERYGVDK